MVNSELNNFVNNLNMGGNAKLKSIDVKFNDFIFKLSKLFYELGLLKKYTHYIKHNKHYIRLHIKYRGEGIPVFKKIKNLHLASRRISYSLNELKNIKESVFDQHILILSTKKGILLDRDCFFFSLGGIPLVAIELF